MTAAVTAEFRLTGVNIKAAKDADGEEITVIELKMVSDDLRGVASLARQRGKDVLVRLEPKQPELPLFDQSEHTSIIDRAVANGHEQQLAELDARDKALEQRQAELSVPDSWRGRA